MEPTFKKQVIPPDRELEEQARLRKRFDALVARTASPEPEEARTSAFEACRMIREQGLLLAFPDAKSALDRHEEAKRRGAQMFADCRATDRTGKCPK